MAEIGPAIFVVAAGAAAALVLSWSSRFVPLSWARSDTIPFTNTVDPFTVSWIGAPLIAAMVLLVAGRQRAPGPLLALAATLNPLALQAYAAGWGLGAAGLFVLTAQLAALPERPIHRGVPLLGVGLTVAAATVPGSILLALPIFSVLFMAAPKPWIPYTMRALYLGAFAMPATWFVALFCLSVENGLALPSGGMPSIGSHGAGRMLLGFGLAVLCAPGLLLELRRRPAGAAILCLSILAFSTEGVPSLAGPWIAWCGQLVVVLRHGGSQRIAALAFGLTAGGLAVFLAL